MKRDLMQWLMQWQQQSDRLPLLLRGARQVGKTFLVESFGKQAFKNCVTINFELTPEFKACFQSLNPIDIVSKIKLLAKAPINENETLLFLDEVQECPEALQSLRYFKEKMPNLHVIAAGSLLEFVLNDENFRMPVGRIESLYLKPLSFYEFLDANGSSEWRAHLSTMTLESGIDETLHNALLKSIKEYFLIGGMPAVVQSFLQQHDYQRCQERQAGILDTYRSDFGKYAKRVDHEQLQGLFSKLPGLIGQTIKYTSINPDIPSRDLKRAIRLLTYAGVVNPVYFTQASGLPFSTTQRENIFKLLFLDIGLVQYTSRLSADILLTDDILLLNRGALAEQFVGQELLALMPPYERSELFFWQRDKPSSSAEVDYVTHVGSHILPIEVKAGKTGRLKSLQLFLQEKNIPFGIRISQLPLSFEKNILSLPLYMIPELPRLAASLIDKQSIRT